MGFLSDRLAKTLPFTSAYRVLRSSWEFVGLCFRAVMGLVGLEGSQPCQREGGTPACASPGEGGSLASSLREHGFAPLILICEMGACTCSRSIVGRAKRGMPEGHVARAGTQLVHSGWHPPRCYYSVFKPECLFLPGTGRYVSGGVGRGLSTVSGGTAGPRKGGAPPPTVA